MTGASGTLPRSRSPSAPHTSFRTPSHSPATNSRSFELGPSRDGSKLFNGRNGPSPLLKDGAQPQSPYDTLPVGRNTLTQKVRNLSDKNSVAFSRDSTRHVFRCPQKSCCSQLVVIHRAASHWSRARNCQTKTCSRPGGRSQAMR